MVPKEPALTDQTTLVQDVSQGNKIVDSDPGVPKVTLEESRLLRMCIDKNTEYEYAKVRHVKQMGTKWLRLG